MIDEKYYVNVEELMDKLPRPEKKLDLPIISIDVGLWSPITWVRQIQNFSTANVGTVLFQDYS